MTSDELEDLLAVVQDAARAAGALVHAGHRKHVDVEHKGAVDLVTRFDRDSEALLRAHLSPLGLPIVGEEGGGTAPEKGAAIFIDPIDGTTNFVHGHPFWCVSIGIAIAGEPVLGCIVSPPLAIEWSGWVASDGSRRALRNDAPCSVSTTPAFEDAMLATGFPYDRRTSAENNFDAFVAIKKQVQAVRRCGAAAIDLCFVADGTYDGYWERKLNPWDVAGGAAIVRAAGGVVTDFDGGSAFLANGYVVATNGRIHQRLIEAIP